MHATRGVKEVSPSYLKYPQSRIELWIWFGRTRIEITATTDENWTCAVLPVRDDLVELKGRARYSPVCFAHKT